MIKSFFDQRYNMQHVILEIGQIFITDKPLLLETLLGSCVALAFFSPKPKLFGLCHAQLPEKNTRGLSCIDSCPDRCYRHFTQDNEYRYVTCAFRYLFDKWQEKYIPLPKLKTALFGGANVLKQSGHHVGQKNIEAAETILKQQGLRIHFQDTGGNKGRTIIFNTESGEISLRYHGKAAGEYRKIDKNFTLFQKI